MLKDRLIFLRTNTTMEYFMKYLFIFNQWLAHGIHSQEKFFKQGVFFFPNYKSNARLLSKVEIQKSIKLALTLPPF